MNTQNTIRQEVATEAHVTVSFALQDIYRSTYGEGGYESLSDVLLHELSIAMVKELAKDRDGYRTLLDRINQTRDAIIREMVTPVVADALTAPIQRTNSYGEPVKGEPSTLREIIIAEAMKVITGPADNYGNRNETRLQVAIRKEVESTWEREIKGAIDAAKAEVRKAVQEKAAGILAKTIQEMAS